MTNMRRYHSDPEYRNAILQKAKERYKSDAGYRERVRARNFQTWTEIKSDPVLHAEYKKYIRLRYKNKCMKRWAEKQQ